MKDFFGVLGDLARLSPENFHQLAITRFTEITTRWQVSDDDARTIIGSPHQNAFNAWRTGAGEMLTAEEMRVVDHVLRIDIVLRQIFKTHDEAIAWLSEPEPDIGVSAIDLLIDGESERVVKLVERLLHLKKLKDACAAGTPVDSEAVFSDVDRQRESGELARAISFGR